MTSPRRSMLLVIVLALLGTSCSRFAPKAGVSVKQVGVNLAFGVEIEEIVAPEQQPSPPPLILPSASPTPEPPPQPPPPEPPICPPTQNIRRHTLPNTIEDREFNDEQAKAGGAGTRPRVGDYLAYFEGNLSQQPPRHGFAFRNVSGGVIRNDDPVDNDSRNGGFRYWVKNPLSRIDWRVYVIPTRVDQAGRTNDESAGIYFQEITLPYADDPDMGTHSFTAQTAGVKLTPFPIAEGIRTTSEVAIPPQQSGISTESPSVPTFTTGTAMSMTATVSGVEDVYVCDQLALAWRVNFAIRLQGETDVTISGNFWLAPQYGGWPIQESFTISSSRNDYISGNFFSRLARIDPAEAV